MNILSLRGFKFGKWLNSEKLNPKNHDFAHHTHQSAGTEIRIRDRSYSNPYSKKVCIISFSYEDLRRDASNLAERLKWKWSGHFARMDNNRWTHKLTMWDPRKGGRNVGRQRTRWADQLKRLAGDQWSRSAKYRVLWI